MDIAEFRSQFPIVGERSYLYNGALTPAAKPVTAALDAWTANWMVDPITCYDDAERHIEELKASFAGLIGARAGEIAVTDNTSRAANAIIEALRNRHGSNVVIDDTTYWSSAYPWLAMTAHEIRQAATRHTHNATDAVASRIDESTVAVCVSHVSHETGYRHDLRALSNAAHERGAILVVDCAQSVGACPIDAPGLGVDALVTTAMKWMLGPPGVGFAYLSADVLETSPARHVGYRGVDLPMGEGWPMTRMPPLREDARRFELGLPTLLGLGAARAGIELLRSVGVEMIHARIEGLVTTTIHGLLERGISVRTPIDPARRCGVIAIDHERAPELAAHLRSLKVDIGGYEWGVARIDPHAFNDQADVEAFLSGLDQLV